MQRQYPGRNAAVGRPRGLPVPLRRTFLPAAAGTAPKPGKPTLFGEQLSDRVFAPEQLDQGDCVALAEAMIKRAVAELRDECRDEPGEKRLYSVEEITDYIYENINQMDFSVQSVAAYFGLSVSNLSHYFKKAFRQYPVRLYQRDKSLP